jgi:hypothetical protein
VIASWCAILALECAALFAGQRRLFWLSVRATGSRALGYALAMPGTVLHESAHYLACLILRVPVGAELTAPGGGRARVKLFRPRRDEHGGVVLGEVPHAATDPLRGALIAVAPLLLVPLLLAAVAMAMAGTTSPAALPRAIVHLPVWQLALLAYVAFSCGQAAFPSPGDHVGLVGAGALLALGVLIATVSIHSGGVAGLAALMRSASLLLAPAALASAAGLAVLSGICHIRSR